MQNETQWQQSKQNNKNVHKHLRTNKYQTIIKQSKLKKSAKNNPETITKGSRLNLNPRQRRHLTCRQSVVIVVFNDWGLSFHKDWKAQNPIGDAM